ncbi:MAG: C-terminal target protein [Mucilaginibacter sp.]|nr:C-terminal target protein [Mucilaginibacter sp.]
MIRYKTLLVLFTTVFLFQSCKKSEDIKSEITINKDEAFAIGADKLLSESNQDFTTITWSTAKSAPATTHEVNGEVVNNKLYIFGGHDFKKRPNYWTTTKRAYVYDPAVNGWSAIADLPHLPNGPDFGGVANEGITNDGTFIYFAGGYISNTAGTGQVFGTKQVWKYDIALNSYSRLPDLPRALAVGQLKYLNGKLHYMGGADLSRNDVGVHYVLDINNVTAGWKTLASLINPVNQGGAVVFENKIYFMGGSHNHDKLAVVQKMLQVYDGVTNTWKQLADMNTGRDHISSSVVVKGNRILVLGGESAHNVFTKLVSAYSPATNTWTELNNLPVTRSGGAAAIINGNIYYTGGNFSNTNYKGTAVVNNNTITLSTLEDAFVRNGSFGSTNYGSDTTLIIKGSTVSNYTRFSFLKFSIGNITNVTSAKLRVYGYNTENTKAINVSCFGVTNNSWTESAITFNNAPTTFTSMLSSAAVNNSAKYIELDVTGFVKTQLAADKIVSLLVKDQANQNSTLQLNSKEALYNKPQLVIQ